MPWSKTIRIRVPKRSGGNLCGFDLCCREQLGNDETMWINKDFTISFKENNFSKNTFGIREMISFNTNVMIKDAILHCNLEQSYSGRVLYYTLETVVEKCNIVNNHEENGDKNLIYNGAKSSLKQYVIAYNSHASLFTNSKSGIASSCFFCNNAFSYNVADLCVMTLSLQLVNADSCDKDPIISLDRA